MITNEAYLEAVRADIERGLDEYEKAIEAYWAYVEAWRAGYRANQEAAE